MFIVIAPFIVLGLVTKSLNNKYLRNTDINSTNRNNKNSIYEIEDILMNDIFVAFEKSLENITEKDYYVNDKKE